jgi:[acyl-carrier-protein] S-malonyltransferase
MANRIPGLAFLFPGQGSQATGMGKELAFNHAVARRTFEEADEALGYDLSKRCFEGPDEQLRLTEITQPAILAVSVAVSRVLAEIGIVPSFVAGHSLGEYSAHVVAGTISFADAVRAVRLRGQYMQEAVPVGVGTMAAIIALGIDQIRDACTEAIAEFPGQVCEPANINSPGQVVISGSKPAVKRAAELRALTFHAPEVPVLCNVEAVPVCEAEKSRDTLIRQVTGTVQWETSMRNLIANGTTQFVEAGPGSVLTGLLRQIDKSQPCLNVENEATLQKAKAHFAK